MATQVRLLSPTPAAPPATLAPVPKPVPASLPSWPALPLPPLHIAEPSPVAPAAPSGQRETTLAAAGPATASRPGPEPAALQAPPPTSTSPALAGPAAPLLRAASADHRHCPPAPYPPALRERGIEGAVVLRVRVDTRGQAADVHVLAGSGFRLFDEAALHQVRRCRFQPAMRGEAALESWVEFPVRFALRAG